MREALRRILWIVPTLLVITVLAFWAVARTGAATPSEAEVLPLFVNFEPQSGRERARVAARSIAVDDGRAEASKATIARLGGAALPHVLPELDTLDPSERSRVAVALAPIARRMGVGGDADLEDPDEAVVFWTRFWQDRAIDFRPSIVKRAVRRHAQRPTALRRAEIEQLDTFALEELIEAMGPVRDEADVDRARRMASLAAHVTGEPWTIPRGASVPDAAGTVKTWSGWWAEHRSEFTTFDGPRRLVAMVTETQYGRWLADALRNSLGYAADGRLVLDVAKQRAPVTLWLVVIGIVGGYLVGIALGVAGALGAKRPIDWVITAGSLVFGAVPAVVVAAFFAPEAASGSRYVAAFVMVALSAAIVSRHQRAATRVALDQEYSRTERALGAGPIRIAVRSFRASSGAVVSLLSADLPATVTAAFVVEHAFGLDGLGRITVSAVSTGDIAWLMAVAIGTTIALALMQIATDVLVAVLDPRIAVAMSRRHGGVQ